MDIQLKEISLCKREVTVVFPTDVVNKEYQKSLKKYAKMVNIKGFRKGKAPISLVEKSYGEGIVTQFREDFASEQYKTVVDELEPKPLTIGSIVDIKPKENGEIEIKYSYQVAPKYEKIDYDGVQMVFEEKKVGAKEVDAELQNLRYKLGKLEEIDSTPKKGDTIYADMKFLESGKQFQRNFIYGSTPYGKEFEDDLKGVKVGDELTSKMDYSKEKDGSQMKEVELKITAIKRLDLPKVDDELAKDAGFEDLKAMKAEIKNNLNSKMEIEMTVAKKQAMVASLHKASELEVPQDLVAEYAQQMAQPYVKAYKSKINGVMPMFMQMAEAQLREIYVMEYFRDNLGVKLTDNEKEKFIKLNADGMKMDLAEYKEKYKDGIDDEKKYFAPALDGKIVDKVVKSMEVVSPEEAEDKASKATKKSEKKEAK